MSAWTEQDTTLFTEIADVAVPRRQEMLATLVAAVPFGRDEPIRIVELGSGDGRLAEALLDTFSAATFVALDGSESMRAAAGVRTARFGGRASVRPFALDTLDWWDVMFGADLIVSSLALHHLNDAKKQYLYKAAAERLSERGVLLVADVVDLGHPAAQYLAAEAWDLAARTQAEATNQPELYARFLEGRWNHFRFPDAADRPAHLLHHLVWLKHAGFATVECVWMFAGHAIYGGFKKS
jgi:tRNA (cmo5U34)-methyltransferase